MNHRRKLVVAFGAGLLAAPLASFAQPQTPKPARIGLLGGASASLHALGIETLRAGLRDLGYVEGKNLVFEPRWAEQKSERLPDLAAGLVGLKVDVIVAFATPAVQAAKQATNRIPIVMLPAGDPVGSGFVASLARPGGNITGLSSATAELAAKHLEIIREMSPSARRVAVLANAADPFTELFLGQIQLAGRTLGITIQTFMVRGEEEFDAAFKEMVRVRVDAVIVQPTLPRKRAADLALKLRLRAVSPNSYFPDEGGLLSYTGHFAEQYHKASLYVGKILKGANPADLPVEQPTKFELVVNMRTARALGIKIPQSILLRTDRVIE